MIDLIPLVRSWLAATPKATAVNTVDEIQSSIGSSLGLKRQRNEDRALIARFAVRRASIENVYLALVCDGLGGMDSGDECATVAASRVVVSTFEGLQRGRDAGDVIVNAVKLANEEIYARFRGNGGTTLSAVLICEGKPALVVNVGDSRVFNVLPGVQVTQLTVDDNIAAEIGSLSPSPKYPVRELDFGEQLTQFVGIGPDIRIHAIPTIAPSKDGILLLATDGAWRSANGAFIKTVVNAPGTSEIVRRAIALSNWCGGVDNTSIIAISCPHTDIVNASKNLPDLHCSCLDIWNSYGHKGYVVDSPRSPSPRWISYLEAPPEKKPKCDDGVGQQADDKNRRSNARAAGAKKKNKLGQKLASSELTPKQMDIQIVVEGGADGDKKTDNSR